MPRFDYLSLLLSFKISALSRVVKISHIESSHHAIIPLKQLTYFSKCTTDKTISLPYSRLAATLHIVITVYEEGALGFYRYNYRKYLRKYFQYFYDCAQNILNICGLLCNVYYFVFLCVNLCANIYDISRIALKIS